MMRTEILVMSVHGVLQTLHPCVWKVQATRSTSFNSP